MQELIVVNQGTIGNATVQTVNARELHAFLEVGKVFGAWIQERIEAFGFTENQDFVVISESGKNRSGGRPTKDYHLTLDMAKELSMVERNEKGKQARLFFIDCERRAKVIETPEMQMARGLLAAAAMIEEKNTLIAQLQPQADALDRIATFSDGSLTITDAAKSLQVKPQMLFSFLSANKWIYRRMGTSWIAYQDKLQQGLLEHKITTVERSDGSEKLTQQVRVTSKGMAKLSTIIGQRAA